MTTVTVIIISLITNIKTAIITIAIIKNDYNNNNNSNNNNKIIIMIIIKVLIIVIVFKVTTTSIIIIMIIIMIIVITITDRYSKLIRSSYRYCFPHCSFFEKNAF